MVGLVTTSALAVPFLARPTLLQYVWAGNTVSATVGMMVLIVIEEDGLVVNARGVGAYL